jgi:hypothetical protein
MPARWTPGLALLVLPLTSPLTAAPLSASAVITGCAAQADPRLIGIAALDRSCPGLEAALSQFGLTALLPGSWRHTLTARGLAELASLAHRYGGAPVSTSPSASDLRILAARLVPPPPPPTWSQRVMIWVRHFTAPLLRGLGRWLRSFGPAAGHPWLARTLVYGIAVLLLAGAAVFLLLELRGIGLLRRRPARARRRVNRPVAGAITGPAALPPGEPEWERLRASPARILQIMVDALIGAGRLERVRHLTCRELQSAARLDSDAEREVFDRVSRLAERELYGPPGAILLPEESLRSLEKLHARLLGMARREVPRPS